MPSKSAVSHALCLATVVALGAASSASAAPLVSAFPSPGTHVAWPKTQLSFRGVSGSQLGPIGVTGSTSGAHTGTLEDHSDGKGVSFLPDAPFAPGERVTVTTSLDVRGAKDGDFTIGIARPGPKLRVSKVRETGPDRSALTQFFHSRHDLTPSRVSVTHAARGTAPGYVFVAPKLGPGQNGPLILDGAGDVVWFDALPAGDEADGFEVQRLDGKPVLTWWQGYDNFGTGNGVGKVFDTGYRQVAEIAAGDGYDGIDPHELQLTPRGTALVTIEAPVHQDLSAIHGAKDATVFDSIVQEIDVKTGLVLFEWHSLDHVGIADSYSRPPKVDGHLFDYFHVNSVDQIHGDGDLLISARNTWGIYKVDRYSGAVKWTLGGKHSTFAMGKGTRFAWQHDARAQPHGTITVFDDGATPKVHSQSHGIGIRLDTHAKTARLVKDYRHAPALLSGSQGNLQALPNGNVFVGWGQVPAFTEYTNHGSVLFDASLAKGNMSYRAFRFPWSGQPESKPDVAASTGGGQTKVYASWNGATGVASWRVLAGASPDALAPGRAVRRTGFETLVAVPGAPAAVAVQALDRHGKVLATSGAVVPKRAR